MYGELLRMAHRQAMATAPPPPSPAAALARVTELRARLASAKSLETTDPLVSRTADMIAYDLALMALCDLVGLAHRLLDAPTPAERAAVEQRLSAAGYDLEISQPSDGQASVNP